MVQHKKDAVPEIQDRIQEIDRMMARLVKERAAATARLDTLRASNQRSATPGAPQGVQCPKCGRDRDFLTDRGGYLGHVLEDPADTEDLDAGKTLICPRCSEMFLYAAPAARTVKTRPATRPSRN